MVERVKRLDYTMHYLKPIKLDVRRVRVAYPKRLASLERKPAIDLRPWLWNFAFGSEIPKKTVYGKFLSTYLSNFA